MFLTRSFKKRWPVNSDIGLTRAPQSIVMAWLAKPCEMAIVALVGYLTVHV